MLFFNNTLSYKSVYCISGGPPDPEHFGLVGSGSGIIFLDPDTTMLTVNFKYCEVIKLVAEFINKYRTYLWVFSLKCWIRIRNQ
jgi:hypothetical protein